MSSRCCSVTSLIGFSNLGRGESRIMAPRALAGISPRMKRRNSVRARTGSVTLAPGRTLRRREEGRTLRARVGAVSRSGLLELEQSRAQHVDRLLLLGEEP